MANRNGHIHQCIVDQAVIERGGDNKDLGEKWDLDPTKHRNLLDKLCGRVSEATPLRLLLQKGLTESDASSHQSRFVISIQDAENSLFRCLSLKQRIDLCDKKEAIEVLGFNDKGQQWELTWKKRVQASNDSISYVFQGKWAEMVQKNRWKKGAVISIWGFPYGGVQDHWNFGPENGFNQIYLVFTSNA